MKIFDFSKEITALTKEKKYKDSLKFFKENKHNFSDIEITQNKFIISNILSCLRHTNNFDAGYKFLSKYNIVINDNTDEMITNAFGWFLYSHFKKEYIISDTENSENDFTEDDDILDEASTVSSPESEIITNIRNTVTILLKKTTNDFSYSVISNLFNLVIKVEKKKLKPNWKLVNDLCELYNPEKLNTDCKTIEVKKKGKMKDMELASDRENWYAYKTKALMKIGNYEECFEISKKALTIFSKYHYSNDVWFARRMALSMNKLGKTKEAIIELLSISRKKSDWFIKKELAELYNEIGDNDNAFKNAISAINSFGDLEFKVDLLFLIGKLLKTKEDTELSFKHFLLSKNIREKEGWKIPDKLTNELKDFKSQDKIQVDIVKITNELKQYWNTFKDSKEFTTSIKMIYSGKVEKILHDNEKGIDGFLKSNEGTRYYFSLPRDNQSINNITVGAKVEFKILPPKDGKKERAIIL